MSPLHLNSSCGIILTKTHFHAPFQDLILSLISRKHLKFLFHPAVPLLGIIFSKELKIRISRRYYHTYVHCSMLHNALKQKEILSYGTTWIDLEEVMLHKTSQRQKDKSLILCCASVLIESFFGIIKLEIIFLEKFEITSFCGGVCGGTGHWVQGLCTELHLQLF